MLKCARMQPLDLLLHNLLVLTKGVAMPHARDPQHFRGQRPGLATHRETWLCQPPSEHGWRHNLPGSSVLCSLPGSCANLLRLPKYGLWSCSCHRVGSQSSEVRVLAQLVWGLFSCLLQISSVYLHVAFPSSSHIGWSFSFQLSNIYLRQYLLMSGMLGSWESKHMSLRDGERTQFNLYRIPKNKAQVNAVRFLSHRNMQ